MCLSVCVCVCVCVCVARLGQSNTLFSPMINKEDIFSVETAVHDIEVIEQEFLCCRIFSKSSCPSLKS